MNIIFFGSSQFAVPALEALIESKHKVFCVVTQPDRKKGRGLHLSSTVVKNIALEEGLEIYQPERINTPEAVSFLKSLKPDLFIVIAYGQILSQEVLEIPKKFAMNIHAALLPQYRGAAPINWAIIKGEKTTGVTAMKMSKEMDAGDIIFQKKLDISSVDTAITLEEKLSRLAAELLLETLNSIEKDNLKMIPQDNSKVSFAPKLKKEDGLIDWRKTAQEIYNLIRGCLEWPGAFTYFHSRLLKIYKARVLPSSSLPVFASPGAVKQISREGIVVATGKDNLIIEELQPEGKRKMKVEEFIAGHKICVGEIFGKK